MPTRADGRETSTTLREFKINRDIPGASPGRVMVQAGRTSILCTASVEASVPPWLEGKGKGWVTAEYNMLPGSTSPRKRRDRSGKIDGRSSEIQRLIGRSLRAVVDLKALGERSITVDCDVLEADGGTRTASITGGFIALVEAVRSIEDLDRSLSPIADTIAAVSVGVVDGEVLLDLDYSEDVRADVDMNVVMTGSSQFVEVQGSGEEATFSHDQLLGLVSAAQEGIRELSSLQRATLGDTWPLS
ncbi:MAG: ribonuclease PH [Planctomycetota bacterium]